MCARQALNARDKGAENIANDIWRYVYRAKGRGYDIRFVWVALHVGIPRHDLADRLANSVCDKVWI